VALNCAQKNGTAPLSTILLDESGGSPYASGNRSILKPDSQSRHSSTSRRLLSPLWSTQPLTEGFAGSPARPLRRISACLKQQQAVRKHLSPLSEDGEALSTIGNPVVVSPCFPQSQGREPVPRPAVSSLWFAAYTAPRHEKAVARQFEVRQMEAFLPLYRSVHRWKNGCRVKVEQPLFPSYVFVSLGRPDFVRALQTPGVLSLVSRGREPSPLSTSEVQSLRSELPLRDFEPHPYLVAGERVRIHSGALAGMVGVLVRKKNHLRVVLTLDLIMQSVSVEIGVDEIEPVRT